MELNTAKNSYYENGDLSNYKNGKLEGVCKWYYKTGELQTECTYKNGEFEGVYKWYYKTGEVETECNYKNRK